MEPTSIPFRKAFEGISMEPTSIPLPKKSQKECGLIFSSYPSKSSRISPVRRGDD